MKLNPGAKLMMSVDDSKNEIILTPFLGEDIEPIKLRVEMNDHAGAMNNILEVFTELGLNLIQSEAHVLRKDIAEMVAIADLNTMDEKLALQDIKKKILENKDAIKVDIVKL